MNNKKLIFIDLDGTLLNSNSKISTESVDIISKIQDSEHEVFIATGRNWFTTERYYQQLNLKTPVINTNGAFIHWPNNPDFKCAINTIDVDTSNQIINFLCDDCEILIVQYTNKVLSTKEMDHLIETVDTKIIIGDIKDVNEEPTSFWIYLKSEESLNKFIKFLGKFNNISYHQWKDKRKDENATNENFVLEILPLNSSKGNAIKYIIDYFNYDIKDCICFGDEHNDVSMFKVVENSFFMKNGNVNIKNFAKNETKFSNDEDGVIMELKKILDIK